ncbi:MULTISPECIES: hypothetical protein [Providencia]|uniref:Uncharacterized protein n=2 Tax=Providencia stuartii TaxID=588 RepID=A0AAI9HYX9_PROST|nr:MULTISPECIES: hypothetical protein [Providencia]ELR5046471.1 hypothetical protein [Providencia rettgeri]ELR5035552.1 hypothetical protein [Providencia stuartii]ELR5291856.1 hypothetical protein [Providencia stuartii]MCR4179627.1 hypothetical protein [Providencia vermicola]URE77612.1 hypothetical protein MWH14_14345 [Providencia stuartii]
MKVILLSILILTSFNLSVAKDICQKFKVISDKERDLIDSSQSGYKVISEGRSYLYTSPNINCKERNVFLIKNDLVNAYAVYRDFTFIMYLNKDGEIIVGWITSSQLVPTGTGIGPADENK